jgi:cell wall-associated NlpC family hydrolase
MATRAEIVAEARSWIGTPYRDHGRIKGQGTDCVGLPVMVCRNVGLVAPDFDVPPYTQHPDGVTLMTWCRDLMTRVPKEKMQIGDLLVFAITVYPQHLAILGDYAHGGFSIIHASSDKRVMRVVESRLLLASPLNYITAFKYVASFRLPRMD